MSNRISLITGSAMVACLVGLAIGGTASLQAQQQDVPLSLELLRDGVYLAKGGIGANSGVVVGESEVIIIDAKTAEESAAAILSETKRLTPIPLTTILLTHSDGDHVSGLSAFPKGLRIIAHADSRKYMEQAFKDPKMSALLPYLPNETVSGDRSLDIGGVRVNLLYFGAAHTSGDMVVYLPDHKIAFIGDLVFIGRDPLVHRHKNGTSIGLVQTLKKVLALDADTFVSGHNDPLTKADIQGLLTSIEAQQEKVNALIQQGKSLDEVKTVFGVSVAEGQPAARRPSLLEIIYQDFSQKE